jgi:hypothetical protein
MDPEPQNSHFSNSFALSFNKDESFIIPKKKSTKIAIIIVMFTYLWITQMIFFGLMMFTQPYVPFTQAFSGSYHRNMSSGVMNLLPNSTYEYKTLNSWLSKTCENSHIPGTTHMCSTFPNVGANESEGFGGSMIITRECTGESYYVSGIVFTIGMILELMIAVLWYCKIPMCFGSRFRTFILCFYISIMMMIQCGMAIKLTFYPQ